ncbi:ATP-binding protein [Naasia lichenicola]|uniref:OmpR/PhoB-type domain-containing protein n=1 Tax=Naasia lichenicola TaxID=2565933 RepID=A0A4S4FDG8_9MICO|nr:AAA family ATPase [Naasia lichenicola]THG28121.1 hypothetical protein E6C64_18570 [Naasia lichenicola]
MRIGLFGGFRIESAGAALEVSGTMQRAVLFRLALDADTTVTYRDLADDVWPAGPPENTRAALQSIVSRLRAQLPDGAILSEAGGYRLAVSRDRIDVLRFQDLVSAAEAAEAASAAALATHALACWVGQPWTPGDGFDWLLDDLAADRTKALDLGGAIRTPLVGIRPTAPPPLTALVGRLDELMLIDDQLRDNRLVTVLGTGGVGKTRLVAEAAQHRPGSVFVELAPVEGAEIWQAVSSAIGREVRTIDTTSPDSIPARSRVLGALEGRELLLVLDNCEHLIDAAAQLADELLRTLPAIRILTTSREPLRLAGEAFVPLGALAHPDLAEIDRTATGSTAESIDPSMADRLRSYPAIELFDRRIMAARGSHASEAELASAARICARLDGLPLALELAAARTRTMSLAEVESQLDDRFALLGRPQRGGSSRHSTLRGMIDWSWELLNDGERLMLGQLAVLPGGASVAHTARLAADLGCSPEDAETLVDRSLVQRMAGRYRVLETIREYGRSQLAESGALDEALLRQARILGAESVRQDARLRSSAIDEAIAWFDTEEDNIAAALRDSIDGRHAEEVVALSAGNAWYWVIRDRHADAFDWMRQAGDLAEQVDSSEGRLVRLVSQVLGMFPDPTPDIEPTADAAVTLQPALTGDPLDPFGGEIPDLDAFAVGAGGHDLLQIAPPLIGSFAAARLAGRSTMDIEVPRGEELGLDPWPTAMLHVARAALAENRGDVATLGTATETAVQMMRQIGDRWALALALQLRSQWLLLQGRLAEALAAGDESTANFRTITSAEDLLQQQNLAVQVLIRQGRWDEVDDRIREILSVARREGTGTALIQALLMAGLAEVARGSLVTAHELMEEIDALPKNPNRFPLQLTASIDLLRARIALLDGKPDQAEAALHSAATSAANSGDQPIMSSVAVGIAALAAQRGDREGAARAIELAAELRGVLDSTDPLILDVQRALESPDRSRTHGAERPGLEAIGSAGSGSGSTMELAQILRR